MASIQVFAITFRFDSETMKSLREEAKQKDISTNTLLNQIVKEHLKWHANASNAAYIAVTRLLITNLISHLSEQEIISLDMTAAVMLSSYLLPTTIF